MSSTPEASADPIELADEIEPPKSQSIRDLAVRGSIWTLVGFGSSQVLRLGGNLILTRLLFPEAFGLAALVTVFIQGLELFSDLGVGPSIIQNKRGDDPDFLNTAWTIQVMRGLFLWGCCVVFAWPVANLWFKKPDLTHLMWTSGLTAAINGTMSTKLYGVSRRMEIWRLTLLDVISQGMSLLFTITLAWTFRSVWAIVVGGCMGAVTKVVLSHVTLPGHRVRFGYDPTAAREIFHFGRWIMVTTAVHFLSSQGDRVLLGRFLGGRLLGIYNVAFLLSDVVARLTSSIGHRVFFPAFGRVIRSNPHELPATYANVRSKLDLAALPCLGVLIGVGNLVVKLLFDQRYQAAGPMLQILTIRTCIFVTVMPGVAALMALGKSKYCAVASICKATFIVCSIPLAWKIYGIQGAVWAVSLSELPLALVIGTGLYRAGLFRLLLEVRSVLLSLTGVALGLLLQRLLLPGFGLGGGLK
jgi:O-antigen/teichoic acid export membrane protein